MAPWILEENDADSILIFQLLKSNAYTEPTTFQLLILSCQQTYWGCTRSWHETEPGHLFLFVYLQCYLVLLFLLLLLLPFSFLLSCCYVNPQVLLLFSQFQFPIPLCGNERTWWNVVLWCLVACWVEPQQKLSSLIHSKFVKSSQMQEMKK